jgi:hypothetical protein
MDLRINEIFNREMNGDTSFTEPDSFLSTFFGANKYTKQDAKEVWNNGIKLGIEIGLNHAGFEQQMIELKQNTDNSNNEKHKEFLEKFYKLAQHYNCVIKYNPQVGLKIYELI